MNINDKVGINDMDAYGMLWYGNHVKWHRRYASTISKKDVDILHLKYYSPMMWGEDVRIRSVQISPRDYLLEMVSASSEQLKSTSLIRVDESESTPCEKPSRETFKLVAQMKGNRTVFDSEKHADKPSMELEYEIWEDMIKENQLREEVALDFFEQMRTRFVGGQAILKKINKENQVEIVVSQINNLMKHAHVLNAHDRVRVKTYILKNTAWKIWEFRQEVWKNYTLCWSFTCKLGIKNQTGLVEVPDIVKDFLRKHKLV